MARPVCVLDRRRSRSRVAATAAVERGRGPCFAIASPVSPHAEGADRERAEGRLRLRSARSPVRPVARAAVGAAARAARGAAPDGRRRHAHGDASGARRRPAPRRGAGARRQLRAGWSGVSQITTLDPARIDQVAQFQISSNVLRRADPHRRPVRGAARSRRGLGSLRRRHRVHLPPARGGDLPQRRPVHRRRRRSTPTTAPRIRRSRSTARSWSTWWTSRRSTRTPCASSSPGRRPRSWSRPRSGRAAAR